MCVYEGDRQTDRPTDRQTPAPRSHACFCSPKTSSTERVLHRVRNMPFKLLSCPAGCKCYSGFPACVPSGEPRGNGTLSVGEPGLAASCWKSHLEGRARGSPNCGAIREALPVVLQALCSGCEDSPVVLTFVLALLLCPWVLLSSPGLMVVFLETEVQSMSFLSF